MTFRAALDAHIRAIRARDLPALAATLPDDDALVLVAADGRVVRTVGEFLDAHRGWFASPTWTLDFDPVHAVEGSDLAVATFRLDYRDTPPDAAPIRQASILTLAFARRGDRWVMVHDQNTPMK